MFDLRSFLYVDYEISGLIGSDMDARLKYKIEEVEFNPFHFYLDPDKHFKLTIYAEEKSLNILDDKDIRK